MSTIQNESLDTNQLSKLFEDVSRRSPKYAQEYYLAVPVSENRGNQKYKFVRISLKNTGIHRTSQIQFHSQQLAASSIKKIVSGARANDEINEETYESKQWVFGQANQEGNVLVILPSEAQDMETEALLNRDRAFFWAVDNNEKQKVEKLLQEGVNINYLFEGMYTPLTRLLQTTKIYSKAQNKAMQEDLKCNDKPFIFRSGFERSKDSERIIKLLIEHPMTDPTKKGRYSALDIALEQGDKELVKYMLLHCVKHNPFPEKVASAIDFCLKHCPDFYSEMSAQLNTIGYPKQLFDLTAITPQQICALTKKDVNAALILYQDMQKQCVAEAKRLKQPLNYVSMACDVEINNEYTPEAKESDKMEYAIGPFQIRALQYCYNCGVTLLAADPDITHKIKPLVEQLERECDFDETYGMKDSDGNKIRWKVNINGVDCYGKTALIHAVESNEPQWVKNILSTEGIKPQFELSEPDQKKNATLGTKALCFVAFGWLKLPSRAIDFVGRGESGREIKGLINRHQLAEADGTQVNDYVDNLT